VVSTSSTNRMAARPTGWPLDQPGVSGLDKLDQPEGAHQPEALDRLGQVSGSLGSVGGATGGGVTDSPASFVGLLVG